jgi:hypothetical protein
MLQSSGFLTSSYLTSIAGLVLMTSLLMGCEEIGAPDTPTESLLQTDLVDHVKQATKNTIQLSQIRKLDGQLKPDGQNYIMDYNATITTNTCVRFDRKYRHAEGPFLFDKFKRSTNGKCTETVGDYWIGAIDNILGESYTTTITGEVHFTKKEKGWTLTLAAFNAESLSDEE